MVFDIKIIFPHFVDQDVNMIKNWFYMQQTSGRKNIELYERMPKD